MAERPVKPMGRKAYGSIPHLPGSRMGSGDHACHEGQLRIATEKVRDDADHIIVQEKVDGSCVAVGKVDGQIIPLGRAGYPAITSPYEQHRLFHDWVMEQRYQQFWELLSEGERVAGEWLAQAHGTRYNLKNRDPWVMFDIIHAGQDDKVVPRATVQEMTDRASQHGFIVPHVIHDGGAVGINAIRQANKGWYGQTPKEDEPEGAIWRVERDGKVDFLVKWVRPDKVDGIYLPETEQGIQRAIAEGLTVPSAPVWNWRPKNDMKVSPWWR